MPWQTGVWTSRVRPATGGAARFDLKYIWMDTDVEVKATGANAGDVDINPWVVGVGVRYRF